MNKWSISDTFKMILKQVGKVCIYIPAKVMALLPAHVSVWMFSHFISQVARMSSSVRALKFLFLLDDELYSIQGQMAIAYGNGVHTKHRHTRYHDFFIARINAKEEVIDIGCGIGVLAYDIAENVECNIVAIDLNASKIMKAKGLYAHPNITYIHGDALKDLPSGSFDVVVLSNVLEHLPDRSDFLNKAVKVTGCRKVLLRVPLYERDWRVPLKKEIGVEWRLDKTHFTEYTVPQFEQEIKDAGLTIFHKEIHWGEIWAEVRV